MKYRIKQKGDRFYPQEKRLLFYHKIKDCYGFFNFGSWNSRPYMFTRSLPKNQSCGIELRPISYEFTSLADAKNYIKDYKERINPRSYRGHKIIKTHDDYYVDITCNVYKLDDWRNSVVYTIYSKELLNVYESIDEFEKQWETSLVRKTYNLD